MRVMVTNPVTGEGFDWEAPFKTVTRAVGVSRFTKISVTLPAEYNANEDANGDPWIMEKGTMITVEEPDRALKSGLVASASLVNDLVVEAAGLASTAKNVPWDAKPVSWISKDALEAWRTVWRHVLSKSGIKNFRITGDRRCGVTVGRGPSRQYERIQADIARFRPEVERADRSIRVHTRNQRSAAQRLHRAGGNRQVGEITAGTDHPDGFGVYYQAHIQVSEDDEHDAVSVHFWRTNRQAWAEVTGSAVLAAANDWLEQSRHLSIWQERRKDPAEAMADREAWIEEHYAEGIPEPYELNHWYTRDLSVVLDELQEIGGFDYTERTEWDGDELVFILEARKRAGRVLKDLRFEIGHNVIPRPDLSRGEVRTEVQAYGSGEGQSTIRAQRTIRHPRLVRTVETVDDKDWLTQQQANRGADKAMTKARKAMEYQLDRLEVHDTPMAPLSQIRGGDEILVRGRHTDKVLRDFPLRVLEIQRTGTEKKAILEVEPA